MITEAPESAAVFKDLEFEKNNGSIADKWVRIGELYPQGQNQPLLPEKFSREQFEQGDHFECFLLTALATLVAYPDAIRNCFVSKKPRSDGRYTFQFYRYDGWVKIEIDDRIPLVEGNTLFIRSPTKHWWPLLIEKALAKFYKAYSHVEGCTLQEALHDLTGNPVLNIPLDPKLAAAAGAVITDGAYWLDLSKKIKTGQMGATALTKRDAPDYGLREEQSYSIQDIVSLNGGTEMVNLLVHLYAPFEEDVYTGPMKEDDPLWTAELRAKFDPSRKNTVYLPLMEFLKVFNSMQMLYLKLLDTTTASLTFADEWVSGVSDGGNPTLISWRHNPMYLIRNASDTAISIISEVRQPDQRRDCDPEADAIKYLQCGLVLTQATFPNPFPTKLVTGNNHKSVHKGLFLNSREVANVISVPPKSLCYLVPTGMQRQAGKFTLGVYKFRNVDYSQLSMSKVDVSHIAWNDAAVDQLELQPKSKDRVDFYVDTPTEIHVLLTQTKKHALKSGGDNMTEDFCGMYLYDDGDKKIAGVAAATNFREISLVFKLPRSGRYAVSITCPKGSGTIPTLINIAGSPESKVRIVDPPADAKDFASSDDDDDEDADNLIDYEPRTYPLAATYQAPPDDSSVPFEDRQFYMDNRDVTDKAWLHITELYPEGKKLPLLPDVLSLDHCEQGNHFECFMLTALAALIRHPEAIKKCFLTKTVRNDGRYAFQFFRYGQWHVVEIDDRIPVVDDNDALFIRSPTHHWWPLLLEKAFAKFYNRYTNIEGCTLQEALHDLTGNPVVSIATDDKLAKAAGYDVTDVNFWLELNAALSDKVACTALTRRDQAEAVGMRDEQTYAFRAILPMDAKEEPTLSNLLVHIYSPFVEDVYTGPMSGGDLSWTADLLKVCDPKKYYNIYMPVEKVLQVFTSVQVCHISDVVLPCFSFHSRWDKGTSGGNPIFTSWRENPLYIVKNTSAEPLQVVFTIRQPDQRATTHLRKDDDPVRYSQCGMVLSHSIYKNPFPTHLLTLNNHRNVYKGLFLNSREVSNLVTIPANSLCYMVPSPMQKDVFGRFMLSYHLMSPDDAKHLVIRRHKSAMALDKPAEDELELLPRSKDRVDFLVDCPTEVHILLHQNKPFAMKNGGDTMTEDFCGLYLYNDKDQRITGVAAATNYRASGLVYQLPKAGRYAISVTCVQGKGKIPIRVAIVATAAAKVRITDPPEDAEEFWEADLSFLDPEPKGIPLEQLNLYDDKEFCVMLDKLKALHKGGAQQNQAAITALEQEMNRHAHVLALRLIAVERFKFLKVPKEYDLNTFTPLANDDDIFVEKEVDRYALSKDPRNAAKVKELERLLNERVLQILHELNNPDRSFVDREVRGVPISEVPTTTTDGSVRALDKRLRDARRKNPNSPEVKELEAEIARVIIELVDLFILANRKFLDQEPSGVPLQLLPLDDDKAFKDLERERYALLRSPGKNASGLKDIEGKLSKRAKELADDRIAKERSEVLADQYRGVPIGKLPLSADPEFSAAERKRFKLQAEGPAAGKKSSEIAALEEVMKTRADAAALKTNEAERPQYLDKAPGGVPLALLPLSTDAAFLAGEARRSRLKHDKTPDSAEIKRVEAELNQRALELAADMASSDRNYLHPEPLEGVPLSQVPFENDAKFKALEVERLKLKSDPKHAAKAKEKEAELNARVQELAKAVKAKGLEGLAKTHEGIPVEDLPIDTDGEMKKLEMKRRALALDADSDPADLRDTDEAMNERAATLAEDLHASERAALDAEPEGIPIDTIPLNDYPEFISLENQLRRLRSDPSKNAAKIKDKDGELKRLLSTIARGEIEKGRSFLNPEPHGVSVKSLPLDKDKEFRELEADLRNARKRHGEDHDTTRALKDKMNDRAAALALDSLKGDRGYLNPEPEGVPLADVPFEDDDEFKALEVERSKLKNAAAGGRKNSNAKGLSDVEEKLNGRLRRLALDVLEAERKKYNQRPRGIRIVLLPIHKDKAFRRLENDLRNARKKGDDVGADDLVDEVNARLDELAKEAMLADRPSYLQKEFEGIPWKELPLDTDEQFSAAEAKRFDGSSGGKAPSSETKELESELNQRALELAKEKIAADRDFLPNEFKGVLLSELPLDKDKKFNDIQKERSRLQRDPKSQNKVADLEKKMSDRCLELATEMLEKERPKYFAKDVLSSAVPLSDLKLEANPTFQDLEAKRWRTARKKGTTKDPEVALIEDEINELLRELIDDVLKSDREFLSPEPEGVPLEFLPYDEDKPFLEFEKQRRQVRSSGAAGPKRENEVAGFEAKMKERTHELARQHLANDRGYLNPEPKGIPVAELPLNADKAFRQLERERQQLKRNPQKNHDEIEESEEKLNNRADAIAMDLFEKDRAFLDPEPEGIAVTSLPLNTDEPFRELEIQRRKAKRDPSRAAKVKELEDKMNTRAHELARDALANDRGYLDPEPEGVLLEFLGLNNDRPFRELEKERAVAKKDPHRKNDIEDLEDQLNDRAKALARELIAKERAQFMKPEYSGVPTEYLPIDDDDHFRGLEKKRRAAKRPKNFDANVVRVMEGDLNNRAMELALDFLEEERAFLDPEPEGIPIKEIPLNADKPFRDMELERRKLRRDPKKFAEKIGDLEKKLNDRAHELARKMIEGDRAYLNPEPLGVALEYLPLDTDPQFHEMEGQRRHLKNSDGSAMAIKELEDRLNDRAHELAREYLDREREYLTPEPEGIPIAQVPIDDDKPFRMMELERRKLRKEPSKNKKKVADLEDRLNDRARHLARGLRGFQDDGFHGDNSHVAPKWVRITDLYPEGAKDSILPERPSGADVESGPDGSGVLAPYLAAMTRNLPLYHNMVETKAPTKGEPFKFRFHPRDGQAPQTVEVDDRIPVHSDGHPAFTRAPNRHWYPMLLEKAYAKFRGGYKHLDHVTPHEVLRDFTGKPVTHIPLEGKLARAAGVDPSHPRYWRGLRDDIARGDIVTAMSLWEAPDGIHRQSSYAIMTVVDTVEGSEDPNDTFVRLHNSYRYAPYYRGPMHKDDPMWTKDLLALCKYDRTREDTLFLPIPVFIRNFVSLQKANVTSGEPITHPGEWDAKTSGGNPNTTSFRHNPVYVMENKGSRTATVIVELRHAAPQEQRGSVTDTPTTRSPQKNGDDDNSDDAECPMYPQTGMLVMMSSTPITVPTQLIAHNAFRTLFKSIVLDSRDVAVSVDVPPTTTCFVIPYTMRRGVLGKFEISLYPFKGKFGFHPLSPGVYMPKPLVTETTVVSETDGKGRRLDFLMDEPSEIHVLAQQTAPYESGKKGNLHAANHLQMALFDEHDKKLGSTGDPSDYREQVVLTRLVQPGRHAILLLSPMGSPAEFPVTIYVYATKKANLRWIATPPGARPLVQSRFPALPKSAPIAKHDDGGANDDLSGDHRRGSLPPIHSAELQPSSSRVPKEKMFDNVPLAERRPKPPPKKVFAFGTSSPRVLGPV